MAKHKTLRYSPTIRNPEAEEVQRKLNCVGPTRLKLNPDGKYGALTMARVMEFQRNKGLGVDGVCGDNTFAKLDAVRADCDNTTPTGRCIVVDLIGHRLFAFNNGHRDMQLSPIHGGSTVDPSHRGVFHVYKRLRYHTSTLYPYPPGNMNFSLYYNGGEAIHQGPGSLPSHGCIHVNPPFAERLFDWAGEEDVLVIVVKQGR